MPRPDDYHEQHGCHDCAWTFAREEREQGNELFCSNGAPERPPRARWDEWSKGRRVQREGICGSWFPNEVTYEIIKANRKLLEELARRLKCTVMSLPTRARKLKEHTDDLERRMEEVER